MTIPKINEASSLQNMTYRWLSRTRLVLDAGKHRIFRYCLTASWWPGVQVSKSLKTDGNESVGELLHSWSLVEPVSTSSTVVASLQARMRPAQ